MTDNLVIVDAFSRVVRLGEGLAQSGLLSQAAMDRAQKKEPFEKLVADERLELA